MALRPNPSCCQFPLDIFRPLQGISKLSYRFCEPYTLRSLLPISQCLWSEAVFCDHQKLFVSGQSDLKSCSVNVLHYIPRKSCHCWPSMLRLLTWLQSCILETVTSRVTKCPWKCLDIPELKAVVLNPALIFQETWRNQSFTHSHLVTLMI